MESKITIWTKRFTYFGLIFGFFLGLFNILKLKSTEIDPSLTSHDFFGLIITILTFITISSIIGFLVGYVLEKRQSKKKLKLSIMENNLKNLVIAGIILTTITFFAIIANIGIALIWFLMIYQIFLIVYVMALTIIVYLN